MTTEADLEKWMSELSNWGRWGPTDQLGTLNLVSPEVVRRAASLVRTGERVSCGREWPLHDGRSGVDGPASHEMLFVNDVVRPGEVDHKHFASDSVRVAFHSLGITHLDALSHCSWQGQMYNGFSSSSVSVDEGALRLGVEAGRRGFVTRGILIDVPYLRGVDSLGPGAGMGLADLEKARALCGISPEPGDAVLFRAGPDCQRSGPLPDLMPVLFKADAAVLGSDTGNDVQPSGYPRFTNPVHQIGLVAMGLWILDVAELDGLARACANHRRWEFLLSINSLPIPRATGSPVNPVAVF